MNDQILVTGGLGYIGSHTVLDLVAKGNEPIIIDDCSNSNIEALHKLEHITGKKVQFYNADFADLTSLDMIFKNHQINSVIHFAALKSVPDSIKDPLIYYANNIHNLKILAEYIKEKQIKSFVFSSSASIYSKTNNFPVNESGILSYENPYAFTKLCGEWLIKELFSNSQKINVGILRYFNPIGNHSSGLIGDELTESSSNIMPLIFKSIRNKTNFKIFGSDYETVDGSPVRDYIHVSDLAESHSLMCEFLKSNQGIHTFNVGLGLGVSVKQLVNKFEEVTDLSLNAKVEDRREGDLPICYADNSAIVSKLGWKPKYDLGQMCLDSFEFFKKSYC